MEECNQYNENGDRHGYWEEYWSSGEIMTRGCYKNGLKNGEWEQYWENGHLWKKGCYVNGIQTGHWVTYFSFHSRIMYSGGYVNGEKDGYWLESKPFSKPTKSLQEFFESYYAII